MPEVTKSRVNREPGRVVGIPLGDGRCGFGRQLAGGAVEFFDFAAPCDTEVDLLKLVQESIAFKVWVMDSAFKRTGSWTLLDVVPPGPNELRTVERWAKRDPISGRFSLYWRDGATSGEEPAELADLEGLEVAAVWSANHVEDRLRDHLAGRPNKWATSLRQGW
ncbi:MAG TPA: Imm26 family immunity protein [Mycobacteriales bacterium]|nr:Imm26 family immunity protein [Mycobacteriales bacterium]